MDMSVDALMLDEHDRDLKRLSTSEDEVRQLRAALKSSAEQIDRWRHAVAMAEARIMALQSAKRSQ
jgi:hypothetical protein